MSVHSPHRPSWVCTGCGAPWPCHTRQRQLTAAFDGAPISLHVWLVSQMLAAMIDLADWPAGQIHDRFLGWLAQPEPLPRPVPVQQHRAIDPARRDGSRR